MTGTALTEAERIRKSTAGCGRDSDQRADLREDDDDEVYRTAAEKYEAIVEEIKNAHDKGTAGSGRHRPRLRNPRNWRIAEEREDPAQRFERALARAGSQIIADAGRSAR